MITSGLARRIIPCLDISDGKVVKGVKFKSHRVVGDALEMAKFYCEAGADELVLYEIKASSEKRTVDREWIKKLARTINIPFCVAGGIDSLDKAYEILSAGAEKVSINSPALSNPNLIGELAAEFGSQCVVVGVDLRYENGSYSPFKFAGSEITSTNTSLDALDWVREVQERGAGEVVINSMDFDGTNDGYNTSLLARVRDDLSIPLVASGGAGCKEHFLSVFDVSEVDGALAAGIFHSKALSISDLKSYLKEQGVCVRY